MGNIKIKIADNDTIKYESTGMNIVINNLTVCFVLATHKTKTKPH